MYVGLSISLKFG